MFFGKRAAYPCCMPHTVCIPHGKADIHPARVLQNAWSSGVWWLRWPPLTFLLLQYPVSAVGLLAYNWPDRQQAGWPARLLVGIHGLWASLLLAASLWLLDLAAILILLASSVEAATAGLVLCKSPRCWRWWLWWLLLPVEYVYLVKDVVLHRLLPLLRAACLVQQLPGVAQVLGPEEGEEEVWAENHMFARMPMEALLEALPQMLLQVVAFFLAGGAYRPSLVSVMFSVTFSIISMAKAVGYILKASQIVDLYFWEGALLMMQLQGSYRVPAKYMRGGQAERPLHALCIKLPSATLSPLQEAGFILAKLTAHARRRAVAAVQSGGGAFQVGGAGWRGWEGVGTGCNMC
jgi:hypothetical protein